MYTFFYDTFVLIIPCDGGRQPFRCQEPKNLITFYRGHRLENTLFYFKRKRIITFSLRIMSIFKQIINFTPEPHKVAMQAAGYRSPLHGIRLRIGQCGP